MAALGRAHAATMASRPLPAPAMTPDQAQLRDALAGVPRRARAALERLADPAAPSKAGEWTPRQVILHLVAVDAEVWQPRLAALVAEDFPRWPWVEPGTWDGPGAETLDGAIRAHEAVRATTVAMLDGLDGDGWARRGMHATFGELDVAALMRIALDHDEEHLAQIAG